MGTNFLLEYEKTTMKFSNLKEMNEQQLNETIKDGKWSVKELIGHLLYWDKFIFERHLPHMAEGEKLIAFPDHDLHNKEAIEHIKLYPTSESLIDDFVQLRRQLIESLSKIEPTMQFTIGTGKRQFTVGKYIKIFVDHDNHHFKQIQEKFNYLAI